MAVTNAGVMIESSIFSNLRLSPYSAVIQTYHANTISILNSTFQDIEGGLAINTSMRDRETTIAAVIQNCLFQNIKAWR